jgi:hypothetical protein
MFFLLFCFHSVRHCAAAPAQSRSTNFVQYFFRIGTAVDSIRPRQNDAVVGDALA